MMLDQIVNDGIVMAWRLSSITCVNEVSRTSIGMPDMGIIKLTLIIYCYILYYTSALEHSMLYIRLVDLSD